MSSYETTISVYGPPTPYEFTVVEAWFETDPEDEYNPDVPRLKMRGLVDDPDWEDFTAEWRTGKNWEVVDEGQAVNHTGGKKQFDGRSQYGKLLDSVVKGRAENDNLAKLLTDLQSVGEAYEAAIWVGRKLVIDVQKDSFKDRETREVKEFGRPVIVDYLGTDADAASEAAASVEAAREDAMQKIQELALTHDSHAQFADAVLTEGLSKDPKVTRDVMDSTKEGLYERIRAENG